LPKKTIIWLFLFLACLNIVCAVPPFFEESEKTIGLQLGVPLFEVIPLASNFTFYFHVFNATNGIYTLIPNCTIHIYDFETGKHILEEFVGFDGNGFDYEIEINDSIFTKEGTYFKLIQCNTTGAGGFFGSQITVGSALIQATIQDAIINSVLVLIFVIFFAASLLFAFGIDGKNKFTMGDKGEPILEINIGKYVKLFLYLLSYLFFWMLSWVAWQISDKFILSDMITGVLRLIFIIETIFWIPLMIFIVAIGLVKHFVDIDLEKTTKRGLFPR